MDRDRIEQLIFHEALLADESRYEEWLAMWADECLYWVPSGAEEIDPRRSVSIIYDDRARLEARIVRLMSGVAHSQQPKSRMRRVISNIEIEDEAGDIVVRSNFMLAELRHGKQNIFAGRTIHKLREVGGLLRIASKTVRLVNSDEVIDNLTFLI
ncbi:MAG TPA: aromatic-ring-hydroxylating dioxygenase subunit beta [Candidatus Binataceae bacterium]|nr:aromatic-ring-hydroxylating dioxygenase subunit beta [Candidatus Binataceae bacterium]